MKIANMLTGKIFISSEQLEEFQSNFKNDVTYGNIKTHKKTGFHPLIRRYIFGKTTGGFGVILVIFIERFCFLIETNTSKIIRPSK